MGDDDQRGMLPRLTMLATRFIAGSETEAPASLYYAEGSAFQRSAHAAAADDSAAGAADAYDGRGFDAKEEPCSPPNNACNCPPHSRHG